VWVACGSNRHSPPATTNITSAIGAALGGLARHGDALLRDPQGNTWAANAEGTFRERPDRYKIAPHPPDLAATARAPRPRRRNFSRARCFD